MTSALASLLDNDLYKFTMQYAVLQHYKDTCVTYQFTNREKDLHLNAEAAAWLQQQIQNLSQLCLTKEEKIFLSQLSFFDETYVDYLSGFRYKPDEHVKIQFDATTGDLELEVSGLWHETILYEVPLLALISESYFRYVDQDWNYEGQHQRAVEKAKRLLNAGCVFSEFGTRRRRDFKTHDIVMAALTQEYQAYQQAKTHSVGALSGTSNVYLAMKYNLTPIGTVAHEFFMAISALEGIEKANEKTLEKWYETYRGALGIALTDTFTTPVFLKDFGKDLATKYIGVRQDSGSPKDFIPLMVNHYKSLGIDPLTKVIVFSDALDVDRAIELLTLCQQYGIKASFGIGTSFTNDYYKLSHPTERSKPMNIVIKIKECNGKRVIKLSDDVLKHSADQATVEAFKRTLGLE
ncbi:nicotinate phosphoribosyltransferase [Halteromyces radiatus]|uniref:nicotinate phosphoribosyltransferase n=1 Tax=Halteromyces radiatus TaxID=101107 RepID=UPI0022212998|nr:nicotinate phosphoribosyltransferase [Halteromyces radiatus]KAI8085996.1 nicotinate phosphoribosyltransferase [Halteromyces radiatus]